VSYTRRYTATYAGRQAGRVDAGCFGGIFQIDIIFIDVYFAIGPGAPFPASIGRRPTAPELTPHQPEKPGALALLESGWGGRAASRPSGWRRWLIAKYTPINIIE
jgi:hypothetical protein